MMEKWKIPYKQLILEQIRVQRDTACYHNPSPRMLDNGGMTNFEVLLYEAMELAASLYVVMPIMKSFKG